MTAARAAYAGAALFVVLIVLFSMLGGGPPTTPMLITMGVVGAASHLVRGPSHRLAACDRPHVPRLRVAVAPDVGDLSAVRDDSDLAGLHRSIVATVA